MKVITAPIDSTFLRQGKVLPPSRSVLGLWISMLDILFVCSPSLNMIFPMIWGPGSNWQKPGPNRRGEVNSDLYYASSGEWARGRGTQEGPRPVQGWPGPEENSGQSWSPPRGAQLHHTLQHYRSWLADMGATESFRKDEVCHVFLWSPCPSSGIM